MPVAARPPRWCWTTVAGVQLVGSRRTAAGEAGVHIQGEADHRHRTACRMAARAGILESAVDRPFCLFNTENEQDRVR